MNEQATHTSTTPASSITADVLAHVTTQLHERISAIDLQVSALQAERTRITRALATLDADADFASAWKPEPATTPATTTSSTQDTLTEVKPRTLQEAIALVLAAAGEPLKAAQVSERVLARGWRSTSQNFRQVIYVALSKHFTRVDGNRWSAVQVSTKSTSKRGVKRSKRGAR